MPFEIFALPAIIALLLGIHSGLKAKSESVK